MSPTSYIELSAIFVIFSKQLFFQCFRVVRLARESERDKEGSEGGRVVRQGGI